MRINNKQCANLALNGIGNHLKIVVHIDRRQRGGRTVPIKIERDGIMLEQCLP